MAEDWHKLVVMAAIAFVVLGIVGIAVPVWRQLAALDASHVANSNIADYRMSEGRGIVIWQCRLMVLQYFQSLLASPSPQNLAAVAAVAASLLTFMLANGDLFEWRCMEPKSHMQPLALTTCIVLSRAPSS